MRLIFRYIGNLNKIMDILGSCVLLFMLFLTVADVVLRYLKMPIVGTYELVGFAGALVIGCALPQSSWQRTHVTVDLVTERLKRGGQKVFLVITRLMLLGFFILLAWNVLSMAWDFYKAGESTLTLAIPLYPLAVALGICCIVECLVLVFDIVRIVAGGKDE